MNDSIGTFIKKVVGDINANLPEDFELSDTINFEVSIISEVSKKGGITLKVVTGDKNVSNQLIQRVRFSIHNPKKQTNNAIKNLQVFKHGAEIFVNSLKQLDAEIEQPKKKLKR